MAAVPLAALMLAGTHDWRWLVVALAAVCVLLPGLAMLAFYYYALSPEGVRSVMPQRAVLTDSGLLLQYLPMDYAEEHPTGWTPAPRMIKKADVKHCIETGEYTTIELLDGETVEIPTSAQPSGMNMSDFFNHLA